MDTEDGDGVDLPTRFFAGPSRSTPVIEDDDLPINVPLESIITSDDYPLHRIRCRVS